MYKINIRIPCDKIEWLHDWITRNGLKVTLTVEQIATLSEDKQCFRYAIIESDSSEDFMWIVLLIAEWKP